MASHELTQAPLAEVTQIEALEEVTSPIRREPFYALKKTLLALLVMTALFCLCVVIPQAVKTGYAIAGTYLMIASSTIGLLALLNIRLDRVEKGIIIIAYGVLFQAIYVPMVFYPSVELKSLGLQLQRNLEMFTQVILFACAGAGGSVIAVHADKSAKLNIVLDNTQRIDDLISITKRTSAQIQKLYALLAIVILFLVSVTVAVLMARHFK